MGLDRVPFSISTLSLSRLSHGGYAKYMCAKWSEVRADKPLSRTALATKGKRLYDRALKDLSANGWLGFDDLEKIRKKVEADFAVALRLQRIPNCFRISCSLLNLKVVKTS